MSIKKLERDACWRNIFTGGLGFAETPPRLNPLFRRNSYCLIDRTIKSDSGQLFRNRKQLATFYFCGGIVCFFVCCSRASSSLPLRVLLRASKERLSNKCNDVEQRGSENVRILFEPQKALLPHERQTGQKILRGARRFRGGNGTRQRRKNAVSLRSTTVMNKRVFFFYFLSSHMHGLYKQV